ncbi:MAG TPA: pyridoxamine 5'-phosphate oxidase family protein, partial [Telluria sp.]
MTNHPHETTELITRIRDIRFPMFTWQDEHGHLLSQPMTQESIDEQGGIWFFTSTLTALWNCIAHR